MSYEPLIVENDKKIIPVESAFVLTLQENIS